MDGTRDLPAYGHDGCYSVTGLADSLDADGCCRLGECSGMTPDPTVQDETANNSDDSPDDRIQGDHADQQECEHHQGSAALTIALSPRDHNSGNGPMLDLSNLRLLCQSHHHRIERELKRERHDHQRPPKIIF